MWRCCIGEDKGAIWVWVAIRGDSVSIVRIRKDRLIGCRSMYNVKPANVRKANGLIHLELESKMRQ